jgi:stage V sporulation protein G
MNITEIVVKLVDHQPGADEDVKLKAYVTIILDGCFAVRDLKLVETAAHGMVIFMPSRKITDRCPRCKGKNSLRARYCNNCAAELPDAAVHKGKNGKDKLDADVCHPITAACRQAIQEAVIQAYRQELERSEACQT